MDKRTANIAYWIVLSLSLVWAGVLFVAGVGWVRGTIQVRVPNPWYNWQEFTMSAALLLYLLRYTIANAGGVSWRQQ